MKNAIIRTGSAGLLCASLLLSYSTVPRASGIIAAYAANRDEGIGNFVTHDVLLLGQELCLEEGLARAEETIYAPRIQGIIQQLGATAAKAPDSAATAANRQWLAILSALISGKAPIEDGPAKEEYEKVQASQGMSQSPAIPETIDYTQFRIRGHYARTPELGRYFRTVRYAGTIVFVVKESASTGVGAKQADLLTAQAMQLAGWISADAKLLTAYADYVRQMCLLFGEPDDLVVSDLLAVRKLKEIRAQRAALLEAARERGHQPQIIGGFIDLGKLERGVTAQDALTGFRLLPQHRTVEGAAFQQLIFDKVGVYQGNKEPRSMDVINGQKVKAFPVALELPALLRSKAAASALDATDERNFAGYPASFAKAQLLLSGHPTPGSWLPVMRQLIAVKAESPEDSQQLLTTSMAYWTRIRHRGLLYEKQSYTPVAKGMAMPAPRHDAYLEPSTSVYKALFHQLQTLAPALQPDMVKALGRILERCIAVSQKEIAGTALTAEDVSILNAIDENLLKIAGREDMPVVVDVHTNPNSQQVLEEAVGYTRFVEFKPPLGGATLRGARLTRKEFRRPMSNRMTDEEWQVRPGTED